MKNLLALWALVFALSCGGAEAPKAAALPRLVDLGAGKCIPCKMMQPVLAELTRDYAGQLEVVFIDVWENADAGAKHGVRLIPTQIFYAPDGKELARHEGFMTKAAILAQWQALGFSFQGPARKSP